MQAKIQKRSKVEIQPKKKKIENPMITKMKQHILNTGRLIEEFFELIQKEWNFPKIIDRITDHYPDGNDKPRSVINAWFSVYNYFIKCHHTYISNSSDPEDSIQSLDAINAEITKHNILKNSSKIDTNTLDSQKSFFHDLFISCKSTLKDLIDEAKVTLNVLISYETTEKNSNVFIKNAYIGSNKEIVKLYDDKTTIKIINQIMKTKIIAKSPGKIDIMDRNDNNKVKTIVQPLDQKFYDMLLIDIETKLNPPTEWLNDNIIDLYGKFIESNNEINIFVFSTSFGSKLFAFNNKLDLEGVKTHAKNVNIFQKQFLFIPLNIQNYHWVLVVVYVKNKTITYYDSLLKSINKTFATDFLKAVETYLKNKAVELKMDIFSQGWRGKLETEENCVQQNNGYDCGVCVCLFMAMISRNKSTRKFDKGVASFRTTMQAQLKDHYKLHITDDTANDSDGIYQPYKIIKNKNKFDNNLLKSDFLNDEQIVFTEKKNSNNLTIQNDNIKITNESNCNENIENYNNTVQNNISNNLTIQNDNIKITNGNNCNENIENLNYNNTAQSNISNNLTIQNDNIKITSEINCNENTENKITNEINCNENIENYNNTVQNNISNNLTIIENDNIEITNKINNSNNTTQNISNLFDDHNYNSDSKNDSKNIIFNNKEGKTVRNNISNNLNIENYNNTNISTPNISNLFDDLLSGDENIFFNNTAKKSQNNISNVKNLKINTDITLQKCSVHAVKAVFDRFVNPDYMQEGRINEFLQNGFSVHNFFVEISNEILTAGGECHQASLIKFILFQFEDLNVKEKGIVEFLNEKKRIINQQCGEFFGEQRKKLKKVKQVVDGNFTEMPNIILHNSLINNNYINDPSSTVNRIYEKKRSTKGLFNRLIDNLFHSISLIYLAHKENVLNSEKDKIEKTKDEIVKNSLLVLRANRSDNPANDPFRDFFLQMYETVVATSTEILIPVIKDLLHSSKNKTFRDIALKNENAFLNLGINVEECLAKRKVKEPTNTNPAPQKISKSNSDDNNNSHSIRVESTPKTKTNSNNNNFSSLTQIENTPKANFNSIVNSSNSTEDLDLTVILGHNETLKTQEDLDLTVVYKQDEVDNNKDLVRNNSIDLKQQIQDLKNQLNIERKRAEEERKRVIEDMENEYKKRREHEDSVQKTFREEKKIKEKQMIEKIKFLENQNEELKNKLKEKENAYTSTYI